MLKEGAEKVKQAESVAEKFGFGDSMVDMPAGIISH
jgi:hypothetical protein|tara:strand:- start:194 stop:301 length:108 start_codon:yes stop_codon:yes gene_type:complete